MKKWIILLMTLSISGWAHAESTSRGDYLVQVQPNKKAEFMMNLQSNDYKVEDLKINNWIRVQANQKNKLATQSLHIQSLLNSSSVIAAQPNFKIHLMTNPSLEAAKAKRLAQLKAKGLKYQFTATQQDNPAIPKPGKIGQGPDPLFSKQWGMNDIGVKNGWQFTKGNPEVIVAVIDTGVDYTHEDLVDNLWRNPGETGLDANGNDKSTNGIDDDNNGYVDDVIGWDFASNDNKPYDLKGNIFQGGNPGHGTHCAGNVAARGDNGKGIAGVAPNVKVMALRFITDKGQGTTADAIKAIKYAVDNGAQVTSNSWGSEGEDPEDQAGNQALRDAVQYAQDHNTLFVAAAGNGHNGKGYDNDTDSAPGYPASYDNENIISVAAIDSRDQLGSFSNWGIRTVDIAAPGVKIFSTTVGNNYEDTLLMGLATWDGTSMATPHVAGAAALYLSKHPNATWKEIKEAIINSAHRLPQLSSKLVSGGKLDVNALMMQ